MSLIRRRKSPNPAERALGFVRLGLKGLVAQRVARKAYKGYKFGKKLPLIAGLGAAGVVVAKKVTGGSSQPEAAPYTPPAAAAPTSAPAEAPKPAAEPATASENGSPEPVAVAEDDGTPPIENTTQVGEVLEAEATTPLTPSAAGTGGAEGEGVPTDEESAEESGTSTDAAPPKD